MDGKKSTIMYRYMNQMIKIDEKYLLNRILEISALKIEELSDITICGTYYFGGTNDKSDIDILIWMNEEQLQNLILGKFGGYYSNKEKIPISIKFQNIKEFYKPHYNYLLPKKSLVTGKEYDLEVNDVKEYLKRKKRI